jgi:hypothetical protein
MDDRETERDRRIRDIAYLIWEEEGRPEGQEERHWQMAESALEQEEAEQLQRKIVEGEPPGEGSGEDLAPFPPVPPPFER